MEIKYAKTAAESDTVNTTVQSNVTSLRVSFVVSVGVPVIRPAIALCDATLMRYSMVLRLPNRLACRQMAKLILVDRTGSILNMLALWLNLAKGIRVVKMLLNPLGVQAHQVFPKLLTLIFLLGVDRKFGSLPALVHNPRIKGTDPHKQGDMVPLPMAPPGMGSLLLHIQVIKRLTVDSKIIRVLTLSTINSSMHNNRGRSEDPNVWFRRLVFVLTSLIHITDFSYGVNEVLWQVSTSAYLSKLFLLNRTCTHPTDRS